MPDLNLMDEGGTEEQSAAPETPVERRSREGGGQALRIVVILVVVAVLGGAVFMLNKLGIVNLWGTKAPAVTQVQETVPERQTAPRVGQQQQEQPAEQMGLIETPAIETPTKAPAKAEPAPTKAEARPATTAKAEQPRPAGTALADMKGAYTIQVSSWRDRATAMTMVQRLEAAGYPAFMEEVQARGATWYTVRVGRYQSISEAKRAVEGFALELQQRHFVSRVGMRN